MADSTVIPLVDIPNEHGRVVYYSAHAQGEVCLSESGIDGESICLSSAEANRLFFLLAQRKPKTFSDLMPGDHAKLHNCDESGKGVILDCEVVGITKTTIVCEYPSDVNRHLQFKVTDGTCVFGIEYGFITLN